MPKLKIQITMAMKGDYYLTLEPEGAPVAKKHFSYSEARSFMVGRLGFTHEEAVQSPF